jgi:hypothetical protein
VGREDLRRLGHGLSSLEKARSRTVDKACAGLKS